MFSRRRLLNAVFVLSALVVAGLVARHFAQAGWPLHRANVWLVALAGVIFLAAYGAKAWGWQRLFERSQRPAVLTLAAAGGAASVGGIALPGRCDDVIRLAVLRRCRRRRASIGAALLSIFLLGLLDSAALAPLAYVAALLADVDGWLRAGLFAGAAAGVAAAGVVLGLRSLAAHRLVARFRIARYVGEHATRRREAVHAWLGVATSWALRALAVFVLLAALRLGTDFSLALAFVCASSASAVLPVAPAGAAVQAGAGAAILIAAGMRTDDAVAFGVAAQALVIVSGAAFVAALGAWHLHGRLAPAMLLKRRASPA